MFVTEKRRARKARVRHSERVSWKETSAHGSAGPRRHPGLRTPPAALAPWPHAQLFTADAFSPVCDRPANVVPTRTQQGTRRRRPLRGKLLPVCSELLSVSSYVKSKKKTKDVNSVGYGALQKPLKMQNDCLTQAEGPARTEQVRGTHGSRRN